MKKRLREKLGQWLGRKPPQMQVAALCRDPQGQVLLVTSRDTGRWIIPKGWPMPGRSLADAARQEAWEEAGVRGAVAQTPIGNYRYDKRQDRGFAIPVEVRVYDLAVEDLAERYPEAHQRRRGWFDPERAAQLVAETGLQALLRGLDAPTPQPDQAGARIERASAPAPRTDPAGPEPSGRRPKGRGDGAADRGGKARQKLRATAHPEGRPDGQPGGQSVSQSNGQSGGQAGGQAG